MKKFTACLLAVLCLSAAVECQLTQTVRSNLTWQVIVDKMAPGCKLEAPQPADIDHVTCQGLWGKEGFVCDKSIVKLYDDSDKIYFETGIQVFGQLVDLMSNAATFILTKPITGLSFNETEKAILTKFANKATLDQKKASGRACMSKLAGIRNSALCTICSAKNVLSFNNDVKGLFQFSNCEEFLSVCDSHFQDFIDIYSSVDMLMKVDKVVNPTPFLQIPGFGKFIEMSKAVIYLLTYRIHQRAVATSVAEKDSISKAYCEQVIKLVLKPYLPASLLILTPTIAVLFAKIVAKQAALSLITKVTSLFGNWRRLQNFESLLMGAPQINAPTDIVVVAATDNMFVSFDGAAGTNSQAQPYKPLNTSLAFP